MSDVKRHLTALELEELLGNLQSGSPVSAGLTAHLAQCPQCDRLMKEYRKQADRMREVRAAAGAPPSAVCPGREALLLLSAGLVQEPESGRLLAHIAGCDACGSFLRIAVEDIHDQHIPAEAESALGESFRFRVSAQLQRGSVPPARGQWRPWRWAAAAVVLVAAAGAAWFGLPRPSAERLVARAFQSQRAWSVRFPDAGYSPQISLPRSAANTTTELAEADAAVARGLESHSSEARWIRLAAQTDFLRRRYDSAITRMEPLAEAPTAPADYIADLGIYYYVRGAADGRREDIERAVEAFSRALRRDPANLPALFNRPLALEDLQLWNQAAAGWKDFLAAEPTGGWSDEARERLRRIEEKKTPGGGN